MNGNIHRIFAYLAQLVEHAAVNRRVVGSSPTVGAKKEKVAIKRLFLFVFFTESCIVKSNTPESENMV